jgi:DNA-directed RNA polymerase subunit RPC12/RpoP
MPLVLIHIARAGVVLGRYPEADLPVLLGAGTVRRTDHFWKAGMRGWLVVGRTFDPPATPSPRPSSPAKPVPRPMRQLRYECLRCGHRANSVKEEKPGNFIMEVCTWLVNPFVGGLYTVSREAGKKYRCVNCSSEHMTEEVW